MLQKIENNKTDGHNKLTATNIKFSYHFTHSLAIILQKYFILKNLGFHSANCQITRVVRKDLEYFLNINPMNDNLLLETILYNMKK